MKREIEEIPDELNPDLMLNITASELLIKVAKGERYPKAGQKATTKSVRIRR